MRILHISDCQGDLKIFEDACLNDSDIVIDTGDLLPNKLHDGLIVDQKKKTPNIKKCFYMRINTELSDY